MRYNPEIHKRRSIRLKNYDYAQQGVYFVTVCTYHRECLFGEVKNGEMCLNDYGLIVNRCWRALIHHYGNIELGMHIIMPNHFHGIINIIQQSNVGAGLKPAPTNHALSEIVRALKTFSSRQINQLRNSPGAPVWQRNYFERVIRNERELMKMREYIRNNPHLWDTDDENPAAL